ncbi:MAG: hypothetical protein BWX59_02364 [Bacteroidetes bacterium ADurb.Bin028]|nr:MAG: hypothetical protein BWX59_02364 [Bacteroidetes bacterium ADurb.Bin028]
MKVYQILTTIIVEDEVDDSKIGELCRENIETAVMEDFYISNCITRYELKETIDYPDTPPSKKDGEKYDKWMDKSQEVIERIEIEMRNP